MKIRRFNESVVDDFNIGKKELLGKLKECLEIYLDFTNDVSPKHWRRTAHHITELRKMISELDEVTPITEKELELDWVIQSRFK